MTSKTFKRIALGGVAAVVIGVAATFAVGSNPIMVGAAFMNELFSIGNPKGNIVVELREAAQPGSFQPNRLATATGITDPGDSWPSYNRTVYGDRYSPLTQIDTANAGNLEVACSFDTLKLEGNQVTPLIVEGAMIVTTAEDIYSIDPATCKQNWKAHEDSGLGLMPVNRGAAFSNGKVIRGYPDGFVRAFNLKDGKRVWETFIGDKQRSVWYTSATTAWNGMVFYGTAGGDMYDIRGRIFGLEAETGKIVWQTFTVPKQPTDIVHATEGKMPVELMTASWHNPPDIPITGGGVWTTISVDPSTGHIFAPIGNPAPDFVAQLRPGSNLFTNTMLVLDGKTGDYVTHHEIMKDDWHDWDMSNAPIFYRTRGGKDVFSFHPKDGHVYSYDVTSGQQLFRNPVTKMLNADVRFEPLKDYYSVLVPSVEANGIALHSIRNTTCCSLARMNGARPPGSKS